MVKNGAVRPVRLVDFPVVEKIFIEFCEGGMARLNGAARCLIIATANPKRKQKTKQAAATGCLWNALTVTVLRTRTTKKMRNDRLWMCRWDWFKIDIKENDYE